MNQDLRTFLQDWRQRHPEDVITISKEVSVEWYIQGIQSKLHKAGQDPILIFEKPVKIDGRISEHKLVTGILMSRKRAAKIIGSETESVAAIYDAKTSKKLEPKLVGNSDAPVKEVIEKDPKTALNRFPITRHADLDPGPYIGTGFVTTYDPETGIPNCALQRCFVKRPDHLCMHIGEGTHNWYNIMKFWKRGEDAPAAIWVGHHPAVFLGANVKTSYPEDHYPYAGGLLGERLRTVPSEKFGEKLPVPADCEVAMEGLIRRERYEAEGPFGEYHGYEGSQRPSMVMDIVSVSHRQDAIWHDVHSGGTYDDTGAGAFTTEAAVYRATKSIVPEVLDVRRPPYGLNVYIKIRNTREGLAKPIIMAALAARYIQVKYVFVFDEDVDIFDDSRVLWAFASRTQLDRDMVIVTGAPSPPLDPSKPGELGTVGGFDCTMPPPPKPGFHSPFAPVTKVPDNVMAAIKLEDYLK